MGSQWSCLSLRSSVNVSEEEREDCCVNDSTKCMGAVLAEDELYASVDNQIIQN